MIKHINVLRNKNKKTHMVEIEFDKSTDVVDFIKILHNATTDFLTHPENLQKLLQEDDLNTDLH